MATTTEWTASDWAVFDWRNRFQDIDQALVDEFMAALSDEERVSPLIAEEDDRKYHAARWHLRKRSEAEAARLGYTLHPKFELLHVPAALVDWAEGEEAGRTLAAKWGFEYQPPEAMWYHLDSRRDGDAIIAFMGDDRGYSPDWEYYIVVQWAPEEFVRDWEFGYFPL